MLARAILTVGAALVSAAIVAAVVILAPCIILDGLRSDSRRRMSQALEVWND